MKRNIILGGISLALFAAGLFFYANASANKVNANEAGLKAFGEKPAACQRLMTEGSCGCTANGGKCGCGKDGNGSCGANLSTEAKAEGQTSCGCQKAAQQALQQGAGLE